MPDHTRHDDFAATETGRQARYRGTDPLALVPAEVAHDVFAAVIAAEADDRSPSPPAPRPTPGPAAAATAEPTVGAVFARTASLVRLAGLCVSPEAVYD